MDGRDVSSQMDSSFRTSQETKTALNLGWSAPGREADVQPAGQPGLGQQQQEGVLGTAGLSQSRQPHPRNHGNATVSPWRS